MDSMKGEPSIVIEFRGLISPADIPGLCARTRALLRTRDETVVIFDAGAIIAPDAAAVDAVARLQLVAKRLGREMRLRHASDELQELIALAGLSEVVPLVRG
jgi:anti-anti-sigma regulatory factor